jgi:HSP20 family molecular chaperone IbpA
MKVHTGRAHERAEEAELAPLVDIYQTEDGTSVLVVELPGASEESVDIRVERGVLTVSAEADLGGAGEGYSRTYTGFVGGKYFRAFALSDEVDREKIEASLTDGVLSVRLPRAAAAKTRRIEVRGA